MQQKWSDPFFCTTSILHERAQQADVIGHVRTSVRQLDDGGKVPEGAVVHHVTESLEPYLSHADMFVTVEVRAALTLRIVHVNQHQPLQTDEPVELLERRVKSRGRGDVVPCGEHVACIKAEAEPRRRARDVEDRPELLELVADRGARPGGRLEEQHGLAGCPLQRRRHRPGDPFHAELVSFALVVSLSLIHISEPTRLGMISYAFFCLKKKNNYSK